MTWLPPHGRAQPLPPGQQAQRCCHRLHKEPGSWCSRYGEHYRMLHKGMEAPVGYFQTLLQENRCVPHATYLKRKLAAFFPQCVEAPPQGISLGGKPRVGAVGSEACAASELVSATLSCATFLLDLPK